MSTGLHQQDLVPLIHKILPLLPLIQPPHHPVTPELQYERCSSSLCSFRIVSVIGDTGDCVGHDSDQEVDHHYADEEGVCQVSYVQHLKK